MDFMDLMYARQDSDLPEQSPIASGVRRYLKNVFQFDHDSRYKVWWDRKHHEDIIELHRLRGEELIKGDVVAIGTPSGDVLYFVKDITPDTDYIVSLGLDAEIEYRNGLDYRHHHAHEMTHGEFDLFHGYLPGHEWPFSDEACEFIGYLGERLFERDEMKQPAARYPLIWNRTPNIIGDSVAEQIVKEQGVDFKAFFHAQNDKELWKKVNDVMIPTVVVITPSDTNAVSDILRHYRERLDEVGLKAVLKARPMSDEELSETYNVPFKTEW